MKPLHTEAKTVKEPSVGSSDLLGASERDWPEDFCLENGAYGHVCRDCGKSFVGHKRRPQQCRKCSDAAEAEWATLTPEQRDEKERALWAWLKAQSPNAELTDANRTEKKP